MTLSHTVPVIEQAQDHVPANQPALAVQPPLPPLARSTRKPWVYPDLILENGDDIDVANVVLNVLRQRYTALVSCDLQVYGCFDNVYELIPGHELEQLAINIAGDLYVQAARGEPQKLRVDCSTVSGCLTMMRKQLAKPDFFKHAPAGIAFANGFLAFTEAGPQFSAHSAANRVRHCYLHDYTAGDQPARWLRCLDEWFDGDDDRAEKIALIQEAFAAAIAGVAPRYRQGFMFYGNGRNGKSVVMKVMGAAMPAGSVTHLEPKHLGNEHMLNDLVGKRLLTAPDITDETITGAYKKFVTGEGAMVRVPGEGSFSFIPTAAIVVGFNPKPGQTNFPKVSDTSDGFFDRWQIITFNRRFEGAADDPTLHEDLMKELPLIIVWALQALPRLAAQRGYTTPPSSKLMVSAWRGDADAIAAFVETQTRPTRDKEQGTAATPLLAAYNEWAARHRMKPETATSLGRKLKTMGVGKTEGSASVYHLAFKPTASEQAGLMLN